MLAHLRYLALASPLLALTAPTVQAQVDWAVRHVTTTNPTSIFGGAAWIRWPEFTNPISVWTADGRGTFEMWFRIDDATGWVNCTRSGAEPGFVYESRDLHIFADGTIEYAWAGLPNAPLCAYQHPTRFDDAAWHHVALTVDGTESLYVDGAPVPTPVCPGSINGDSVPFMMEEQIVRITLGGQAEMRSVRVQDIVAYSGPFTPSIDLPQTADTTLLLDFDGGPGQTIVNPLDGTNPSYIYNLAWRPDGPDVGQTVCTSNPNSIGLTAKLRIVGSPTIADNTMGLLADDLSPNEFGLFVIGTPGTPVPLYDGVLCFTNPFYRLWVPPYSVLSTGTQGFADLVLDLQQLPQGLQVQPQDTWRFQFWYRDGSTANLTDAIDVTFQ